MQSKLFSLKFSLLMISLQLQIMGLVVWVKERAYHAVTAYTYRTGLVVHANEPDDDDIEARIAAAVEAAVGPLKTKNKELLGKLKKLQSDDAPDPAEVERLESQIDELKSQLTAVGKDLKTAKSTAEKATADLAAEQAHTQRLLVDNGLAAALTEAGVTSPTMHRAAAALIRQGQKIEIAADGETRLAKIGDVALGDFVKTWAQGDEGKAFVAAPGNGGGGATGSGGKPAVVNPWAKDTYNLTQQSKLYTENPTQAKLLAAEQGVTL